MDQFIAVEGRSAFRKHSFQLIVIGMLVWLAIGSAMAHLAWLHKDNYGENRLWAMALIYLLLYPFYCHGSLLAYQQAQARLTGSIFTNSPRWWALFTAQYLLLILFSAIYVSDRSYDNIVTLLLMLLSPQLIVFVSFPVALGIMALMDLPLTFLAAHDSPFALGVCLLLLHAVLMGQTKASLEAQQARISLENANFRLQLAQRQLEASAKQSERLRIARDLHDKIGHHLVALNIRLQIASLLAANEVKIEIEKSRHISSELLQDVRMVVSDMRLPSSGLTQALQELIAQIRLKVPATRIIHKDAGSFPCLAPDLENAMILSTQELITNALKHGNPSEIQVSVQSEPSSVVVQVRDNGKGAAMTAKIASSLQEGNGLKGIRERLAEFNGSLELRTLAEGIEATVRAPIQTRSAGDRT